MPSSGADLDAFVRTCLSTGFVEAALHFLRSASDELRRGIDPSLVDAIAERGAWGTPAATHTSRTRRAFDELHPFDQEIARLVAAGRSNASTAAALNISINTVSNRLKRIYQTMRVHNRTELRAKVKPTGDQFDPISALIT